MRIGQNFLIVDIFEMSIAKKCVFAKKNVFISVQTV